MKKLLSYSPIMMLLVAAMTLTSCGNRQAETETEKEVPLTVTYYIECSQSLMDLCDLVVTYIGEDGANIVDTITASPDSTKWGQMWTKSVQTDKIPMKIGLDYTFVQKTDTLISEYSFAILTANCMITVQETGVGKEDAPLSKEVINSKYNFSNVYYMISDEVINTRQNLADIIDIQNDRQAYKREHITDNGTCFIVKPNPYSDKGMVVKSACWKDNTK